MKLKNIFNSYKLQKPKSNMFDLTHDIKMSGQMGKLIPSCLIECVPGDKFNIGTDIFVRFAPLIAPVFHRLDVTIHYFFVPNRLVWDNWEKFITNQETGGLPYFLMDDTFQTPESVKLFDYLGVPPCPIGGTATPVSALPAAAYQCIYNEYYRDENLVPEVDYKLNDGFNVLNAASEFAQFRTRAWEHDYFTAALPWAQKGQAVEIPIGDIYADPTLGVPNFIDQNGNPQYGNLNQDPGANINVGGLTNDMVYDPDGTLTQSKGTINELRRAFRLQEWLEKNAHGGTRYIENILVHFGVRSSDKRLQRPEYICGTKTPVVISEVLNMTGEDGGLPQGNMAGHGVAVAQNYDGSYYCEEHGYILGILSVMPTPAYQQGINRTWKKFDPLDYYWPSFANIGEQEVKNDELYAYGADPNGTFGYIPRYAEYKYLPSRVCGDFRNTLDYWHLGRKFANEPTLSQEFIEMDYMDFNGRIFAVDDPSIDQLYMHVLNKIKARRPMPVFGTPMI